MPSDLQEMPSYAELMTLLERIGEHAERLPGPLAVELVRLLGRFASSDDDDQPRTP